MRMCFKKVTALLCIALSATTPTHTAEKPKSVSALVKQFEDLAEAVPVKPIAKKAIDQKQARAAQQKMTTLVEQTQPKVQACDLETKKSQSAVRKFKSLKELQDYYAKDLKEQEATLLQIFFDVTGITAQEFETIKAEFAPRLEQLYATETKKLEEMATKVGTKENLTYWISSASVPPTQEQQRFANTITAVAKRLCAQEKVAMPSFFFSSEHMESGMEIGYTIFIIDVSTFMPLPSIYNETIILHEIGHLKFEDALIQQTMTQIFKETGQEYAESFMQLWNFFREKRADIFAWTHSIEYAKAGFDYFCRSAAKPKFYEENLQHQSDANRAAIARQIYQEMLAIPNPR